MRGRRVVGALAVALVTTAGERVASAQVTSDQMLAQSLFDEGRQLMAKGRYAEACPKLAESQRLDPGGGTLTNLALCHEHEGKTGSAYLEFMAAAAQAAKDGRKDRERIANDRLAVLGSRVPKLAVHVERPEPGLEVRLDGTVLREPAWDVASVVDPGRHMVEASARGRASFRTEVTIAEGEQRVAMVAPLRLLSASPEESNPQSLPPSDARVQNQKKTSPWFITSAVLTTVGFTVAIPAASVWGTLKLQEPTCGLKSGAGDPLCQSPSATNAWFAVAVTGLGVGLLGSIGLIALPHKVDVKASATANGGAFTVSGSF